VEKVYQWDCAVSSVVWKYLTDWMFIQTWSWLYWSIPLCMVCI